ncbi:adenylate/guanylate cyclase domain-containing protein [Labrys monachus]|uniref:Adenylate cyclase n=1 Tax=Labrys monachus TaxID=217067 RepID=A0ABU0FNF0_9HYPH|nr:adenylate/guanylate cyclase domain-containing protein [Labrys monachus]MDQ0396145.1 adenylate cyclase [Labrys monachus]
MPPLSPPAMEADRHPVIDRPAPTSRIAAILAADASGYSRAMSQDEARALAALAASRSIIDRSVASRQGRIFSTGGDSVLAEFASGEQAVRCGREIQAALAGAAKTGEEVLSYRIGIHAGRVHLSGGDLLGETVNIAARLESIANPGGICISKTIRDGLDVEKLDIEDMGARLLKGIREPIEVARIRLGEPGQARGLEGKFSIAVPPFACAGADDYWGEGLADDLIAALSRFKNIAVLAAAPRPAAEREDPRRVAAALGVRFVLAGAVRVEAGRFRLSVRLLDGASGVVLWAHRYDERSEGLLNAQDRLVESVAGILAGRLAEAGADTAQRKRTESLDAFDLMLQGTRHANRLDPASSALALGCFEKALAIDPDYAGALAMLALMRLRAWALHPGSGDLAPVADLAGRALALDPADGWSHLVMGQIALYRRQLDIAEVHHKKAHALNPYDARILALRSPLATYLGKPEEGRAWIERAMRLDPLHPAWYATNLGLACYCARDYADGAAAYAGVAGPQAGVLAGLAACRAQLGDADGAGRARAALLAAKPDFSARIFIAARPFKYELDSDHLLEGLRKAGLPD